MSLRAKCAFEGLKALRRAEPRLMRGAVVGLRTEDHGEVGVSAWLKKMKRRFVDPRFQSNVIRIPQWSYVHNPVSPQTLERAVGASIHVPPQKFRPPSLLEQDRLMEALRSEVRRVLQEHGRGKVRAEIRLVPLTGKGASESHYRTLRELPDSELRVVFRRARHGEELIRFTGLLGNQRTPRKKTGAVVPEEELAAKE